MSHVTCQINGKDETVTLLLPKLLSFELVQFLPLNEQLLSQFSYGWVQNLLHIALERSKLPSELLLSLSIGSARLNQLLQTCDEGVIILLLSCLRRVLRR